LLYFVDLEDSEADSETQFENNPKEEPTKKKKLRTHRARNLKEKYPESSNTAKINDATEEKDVESVEKNPKITVATEDCPEGKAFFKDNYCTFCKKSQRKIVRHLEEMHLEKPEVQILIKTGKKKSVQRTRQIACLKYRGDHEHNLEVISQGFGELNVARRPKKGEIVDPKIYTPCPNCFLWISKWDLNRHNKKGCPMKNVNAKKNLRQKSDVILMQTMGQISKELAVVLSNLNNDEVAEAIKHDETILLVAQMLIGNQVDLERCDKYFRDRMREMGRLLIQLKKAPGNENRDLKSFIQPSEWDFIIESVITLSDSAKYTLAVKLGHAITKICDVLWGQAVRKKNKDEAEDADFVQKLYEREWSSKVSSRALKQMRNAKLNKKIEHIPNGDVVKFSNGLKTDIKKLYDKMLHEPSTETAKRLCEACLVYLVIFNRKRVGEVAHMEVVNYTEAKKNKNDNIDPEIFNQLSDLQKEMSKRHVLAKIIGKKQRHVPILLPIFLSNAVDVLLKNRNNCGITTKNKYLFARPGSDKTFAGCGLMRKFSLQYNLEKPKLMRSTNLRKHLATSIQVIQVTIRLDQI
jgi:hypothetical protein